MAKRDAGNRIANFGAHPGQGNGKVKSPTLRTQKGAAKAAPLSENFG